MAFAKRIALWCLVSLMARECLADCCWDSDGWAEERCDPSVYGVMCGGVEQPCCTSFFCKDGSKRVGSYCSEGSCNSFGCACDGGCIQGKRRRLTEFVPDTIQPSTNTSDIPPNRVAECQRLMASRFNTYSLTNPFQIREYFDCLSTNGDNVLDAQDSSYQHVQDLVGDKSLVSMDTNGDGKIDATEFDPVLDADEVSPSSMGHLHGAVLATCTIIGLLLCR